MKKNIIYLVISVLIISSSLYQYDQIHGFDLTFNPALLLFSLFTLIGIGGVIGLFLTKLDNKRGYCDLGISDEKIRQYKEKHANKEMMEKDNDTDTQ